MKEGREAGALRFPTARLYKVEELIEIYEGIVDDIDAVLKDSQIAGEYPRPVIPDDVDGYLQRSTHNDPIPPDDLTMVPDHVIGKLFSYFQNWANYVSAEASRARTIKDTQERQLKVIKSALTIHYREDLDKPASLVEDYINTDQRFTDADAKLLRIKGFYNTVATREDELKSTINNISREQTRRKDELERLLHDERGGGLGGQGGGDHDSGGPSPHRRKRFGKFE